MKNLFFLFTILFAMNNTGIAQFKNTTSPALNMDNSIAAILTDLCTQNKDYLLQGEKSSQNESIVFYPNKLFGATNVFITANYNIPYNNNTNFGADFKFLNKECDGMLVAMFSPIANLSNATKKDNLSINLAKSNLFNMFFTKDEVVSEGKRNVYVQKAAFKLPPNYPIPPAQLDSLNKAMANFFEDKEVRISVNVAEKTEEKYNQKIEFTEVVSWVQVKPIAKEYTAINVTISASLPTKHADNTTAELTLIEKFENEIKTLEKEYKRIKTAYASEKNKNEALSKTYKKKAYTALKKYELTCTALENYIKGSTEISEIDTSEKMMLVHSNLDVIEKEWVNFYLNFSKYSK
jgi:hypothetical protein